MKSKVYIVAALAFVVAEVVLLSWELADEGMLLFNAARMVVFGVALVLFWLGSRQMLRDREVLLEAHEESEKKLRESEEKYRLIADNAGDVIWVRDMDLNITYISPSVVRLTGRTVEEEMAAPIDELGPPESLEIVMTALTEELALEASGSANPDRSRSMELELYRKDWTKFWTEMTLTFIRDGQGKATGILGVTRDITERKQQEAERRLLEAQVVQSQRMEGIGRLAGGVAHDFNNMLSVILNYADFLEGALASGDPRARDVAEIKKAAKRGALLTSQLLSFSRKQTVSPEVLDLCEVAREMESILARTIGEDVQLKVLTFEHPCLVKTDAGQMQQAVMNLVLNARDAMPTGGKILIEVGREDLDEMITKMQPGLKPGPHVYLRVTDTGMGMSDEVAAKIFEPFFTTKQKGKGTGLGLSTVYGTITQAGGTIGVDSTVDVGTIISVWLPESTEAPKRRSDRSLAPQKAGEGRTIMVVEDEPAVLELIERILTRRGYKVMAAGEGQRAIEMARAHEGKIDLLLTDVIMPGYSGRDVADAITADRPDTAVLFMSGYTDDIIGDHGVLESGVEFIHKPFDAEQLVKKIRAVLDSDAPAPGADPEK